MRHFMLLFFFHKIQQYLSEEQDKYCWSLRLKILLVLAYHAKLNRIVPEESNRIDCNRMFSYNLYINIFFI